MDRAPTVVGPHAAVFEMGGADLVSATEATVGFAPGHAESRSGVQ
jgi:hypothetical protein